MCKFCGTIAIMRFGVPHTGESVYLKLGPVAQKTLLLLAGGVRLSLTRRPDAYFRILKDIAKEWKKINHRSLRRSIGNLYQSKLINYKENSDGTVTMTLTADGKRRLIHCKVNELKITKPEKWDGIWRMVLFDIPEKQKRGRNALAVKLKELGFYPMQKSVFVHPYECKEVIDFVTELYELAPFVRFIRTTDIDIALHLKHRFGV